MEGVERTVSRPNQNWNDFLAKHGEFLLEHGIPAAALTDDAHFGDFFANADFDYHEEKADFDATRLTVGQATELLDWLREWLRDRNPRMYSEDSLLSADLPKELHRYIEWSHFLDRHGAFLRLNGIPDDALVTQRTFEDFVLCGERYGKRFAFNANALTHAQAQSLLGFFEEQSYDPEYFQREYFLGRHIADALRSP